MTYEPLPKIISRVLIAHGYCAESVPKPSHIQVDARHWRALCEAMEELRQAYIDGTSGPNFFEKEKAELP